MKRTKNLLIATTAIVAIAATLFVGCKKDKDENVNQTEKTEAASFEDQIKAFQALRDAVASGAKADGIVSVEEMRQILDLAANFEHSEHMTCCVHTILDTLYLAMPQVDENGGVTEVDVVAAYEAFETELRQHMATSSDGRNLPSYFSIVMPEKGGKAEENIMVVFLRGEEEREAKGNNSTYDDDGPFVEDDDWFWGDSLGLCKYNPYNSTEDAAQRLSYYFGFEIPQQHVGDNYYVYNVVHVNYRPCEHSVYGFSSHYYVDSFMEDCADTWLFCYLSSFPEDPCVVWEVMNCFWRSVKRNIVDLNGPLHYTLNPDNNVLYVPYHCCYFSPHRFYANRYYYQVHVAHVTYCDVIWDETPLPPVD